MDLFPISEIFVSVQGEGNYVGTRALFIRFQYCNLTCTWCDTKYTWFKKSGKHQWYSADEIKAKIISYPVKHVIFTGGEPTLFDLSKLYLKGIQFHVESNGTISPENKLAIKLLDNTEIVRDKMDSDIINKFNWVISPKLSNSSQPLNMKVLKEWGGKDCIFKFIVKTEKDIAEITALIDEIEILKDKVYLGLEGVTKKSQLKPGLVETILNHGFNFSPRLQVLLWDRERKR